MKSSKTGSSGVDLDRRRFFALRLGEPLIDIEPLRDRFREVCRNRNLDGLNEFPLITTFQESRSLYGVVGATVRDTASRIEPNVEDAPTALYLSSYPLRLIASKRLDWNSYSEV